MLDAGVSKNVDIILNLNVKKQKGSLIFVTDAQRLRKNCPLEQFLYLPDEAEDKARERLVLTREGVNLTSKEYEIQNNILKTAIIENRQSIHHALVVHKDELNCAEKTLYRRIDKGVYTVRNHHLPRQVNLKKRKIKKK